MNREMTEAEYEKLLGQLREGGELRTSPGFQEAMRDGAEALGGLLRIWQVQDEVNLRRNGGNGRNGRA